MGEWFLKALVVGFGAWVIYHLLRPRYAFEIRINGGQRGFLVGIVPSVLTQQLGAKPVQCAL